MKKQIPFLLIILCLISPLSFGETNTIKTTSSIQKPWGIFVYYSKMTDKLLNQVLRFDINVNNTKLYSIEGSYQLDPDTAFVTFFNPLFHPNIDLAMNVTYQDDPKGNLYELNPFFDARWGNFSWDKYLTTTFAIGEGVSYATSIPYREIRTATKTRYAKRLLNFLMFEATFALPKNPNLQFVYRLHHRSGVFGLYKSSNSGSTAIGFGVRYLF